MSGPPWGDAMAREEGVAATRPITPGVEWIHECFALEDGRHEHVSVYLVRGPAGNLVVDSGSFLHRKAIRARLERALGGEDLHAIILSHTDYPHSGNVPDFLSRWGKVEIVASCSDAEVQGLPYARRSRIGQPLEVCGRTFRFLDPPLADRSHTTWIHDVEARVVFAADGFGNYHTLGECDRTSRELDAGIRAEDVHRFHEDTLVWLRYVDPPVLERALAGLVDERPVEWICPIHGNPIHASDLPRYLKMLGAAVRAIREGAGSR